jgi:hypothetical protein
MQGIYGNIIQNILCFHMFPLFRMGTQVTNGDERLGPGDLVAPKKMGLSEMDFSVQQGGHRILGEFIPMILWDLGIL